MRLNKFFRRYTRTLLMIFMSLLLVTFLLGDVLQSAMTNRGSSEIKLGTSRFGDVDSKLVSEARAKQDILRILGFSEVDFLDALDMYLLIEEAREIGVRIGHGQVERHLVNVFGPQAQDRLELAQKRTGRSYPDLKQVAADWLAVQQLIMAQAEALGESLPRAELAFRDRNERADLDVVAIDARAFLSRVPEPSEDELQALFDEGRDRFTAHTDDALVFGYKYPDRVRLEVLTVDPQKAEAKVRIRERDVEKFFEEHQSKYSKPGPMPATAPLNPADRTRVQMTFDEAREQVRKDYRMSRAILEAQSQVNEMRSRACEAWQAQPLGEDQFRVPPPADQIVPFTQVRDLFADKLEVTYEATELLSQDELAAHFSGMPGGMRGGRTLEPMYVEGRTTTPMSELAMRVKGLYTPTPDQRDRLPYTNVLEPGPVLQSRKYIAATGQQDAPYQSYVYRVLEVQPSAAPASLAEVREKVVADWKLRKAYEMAGAAANQLAEQARTLGLVAAADQATELKSILGEADAAATQPATGTDTLRAAPATYVRSFGPNHPAQPLSRVSNSLQILGTDIAKVRDQVFAALAEPAADHRVVTVDQPTQSRWVIAEVREVKPAYAGAFEKERGQFLSADRNDLSSLYMSWIVPSNVRQRAHYVADGAATDSGQ